MTGSLRKIDQTGVNCPIKRLSGDISAHRRWPVNFPEVSEITHPRVALGYIQKWFPGRELELRLVSWEFVGSRWPINSSLAPQINIAEGREGRHMSRIRMYWE